MNLDQLLAAYRQVAERQALPPLQAAQLHINSADLDSPEAVWQQIDAFAPDSGWLCFQSMIADLLPGQPLPRPDADSGLLLSAECHNSNNGYSLQLRQNGRGGWRLSEFRPRQGQPCLCEDYPLIAHRGNNPGGAPRRLRYRRYWTLDDDGTRQRAACFIGFDAAGEQ